MCRRASARTHARDPSVKPYQDFAEFASDVRRVFSNAALYHDGGGVSPAGGGGGDQQVRETDACHDLGRSLALTRRSLLFCKAPGSRCVVKKSPVSRTLETRFPETFVT